MYLFLILIVDCSYETLTIQLIATCTATNKTFLYFSQKTMMSQLLIPSYSSVLQCFWNVLVFLKCSIVFLKCHTVFYNTSYSVSEMFYSILEVFYKCSMTRSIVFLKCSTMFLKCFTVFQNCFAVFSKVFVGIFWALKWGNEMSQTFPGGLEPGMLNQVPLGHNTDNYSVEHTPEGDVITCLFFNTCSIIQNQHVKQNHFGLSCANSFPLLNLS